MPSADVNIFFSTNKPAFAYIDGAEASADSSAVAADDGGGTVSIDAGVEGADTFGQPGGVTAGQVSGDWAVRSTAGGVIWSHDFANENELRYFTRLNGATSNPNTANLASPLTLVDTKFGSKAISSKGYGAELKIGVASAGSGVSQDWTMVNVALWPDPGAVGSYNARVGTGVSQTNGLEEVLVTAINYITNVVTLTRGGGTSYSPGYALGFQAKVNGCVHSRRSLLEMVAVLLI